MNISHFVDVQSRQLAGIYPFIFVAFDYAAQLRATLSIKGHTTYTTVTHVQA